MSSRIYDSSANRSTIRRALQELIEWRELIFLLVKNEISVRYKRSFLGLAWTLLNPLLISLILWFVFINAFASRLPTGTEFAPYVFSGVLLLNFFSQGFNQSAESIQVNVGILLKIYVPPQVFAFSSALANALNFVFGLFALAFVSTLTGDGISAYFPLAALVILAMLLMVSGAGLFAAAVYVRYSDFKNIFSIFLTLLMYLSPVFYPKEILSTSMLFLVNLNPLTSFLDVFRSVFSNTGVATFGDWAYMSAFSCAIFILGLRFFLRKWPQTVVMI